MFTSYISSKIMKINLYYSTSVFRKSLTVLFLLVVCTNGYRKPRRNLNFHRNIRKSRDSLLQRTPVWDSYQPPIRENSKYGGYGYSHSPTPYGMEIYHNYPKENENDDFTTEGVIKFAAEFLEVMGPFLFPLPYFLALVPFAIPAIPLALYLDIKNAHNHHRPVRPGNHTRPTLPTIRTTTTTKRPTDRPPQITPMMGQTQAPPTFPDSSLPPLNVSLSPINTSLPTFPTTSSTTLPSITLPENEFPNNTDTDLDQFPTLPPPNLTYPTLPPLFPYPLFLNSSWLEVDYADDEMEEK